jgi:hypothetical protein
MNIYTLNSIDLSSLGFIPGKQSGSNVALAGCFDMPERTGKTFHNWGDDHGIEPYVSAAEISFGGRSISLVGYVYGTGKLDCTSKANRIFELIDRFSGLVPLSCKWGTYMVSVNQPVTGTFIGDKALKMTLNFFEPTVPLTGTIPTRTNAEYGIDGISFKDLGGTLLLSSGDRTNRPSPKTLSFTSNTEDVEEIKTEAREITLKIFVDQPDSDAFKEKVDGLQALFSAPGLRELNIPTDFGRRFFVKNGFKLSNINSRPNRMTGFLECKITEGILSVPTILPPRANAGPNSIIFLPDKEILVTGASALARVGAVVATLHWELVSTVPSGLTASITEGNKITPRMTNLNTQGEYSFKLTVTDSNGLSATDTMQITVLPAILASNSYVVDDYIVDDYII